MRHQPLTLAFVVAVLGAAAVTIRPGAGAMEWTSVLVGGALTAAMTNISATILQFLPARLFPALSIAAGALVALGVALLVRAAEYIGLGHLPAVTTFVWGAATIVALLVTRAAGVRLPPLGRARR